MHIRETFSKFFADRGTHLAAMIAYFALLSFVPLVFLALALLGLGELRPALLVEGGRQSGAVGVEHDRGLDLRGDLGQVG